MPALDSARRNVFAGAGLVAALVAGFGLLATSPDRSASAYFWLITLWGGIGVAWLMLRREAGADAVSGDDRLLAGAATGAARRPQRSASSAEAASLSARSGRDGREASGTGGASRWSDERSAASGYAREARFLTSMSHDLRQPMQALTMFAATLATHPLSEASRKLVNGIESAAEALSMQFEAMCRIARLEAGRVEFELTDVSLDRVLTDAVAAGLDRAHERGLHLRHVATHRRVVADEDHLATILNGLIDHALGVTASGGIVVGCRSRGDRVVIEVWDSSPGAGPELLPEAFIPGAAYGRRLPDHGLGLVLASRLAFAMGGDLRFDSRAGRGNVLRLTLPSA